MNCNAFFDEREGLDNAFRPKVVEDGFNGGTGIKFDVPVSISDAAFLEHIGKSKRRCQLIMRLDFVNAVQDVIFQRNNSRRVNLIWYIKQAGIVADNLRFSVGDNPQWRFAEEVDSVLDELSVDFGVENNAG